MRITSNICTASPLLSIFTTTSNKTPSRVDYQSHAWHRQFLLTFHLFYFLFSICHLLPHSCLCILSFVLESSLSLFMYLWLSEFSI
jgi:hypothetical protein